MLTDCNPSCGATKTLFTQHVTTTQPPPRKTPFLNRTQAPHSWSKRLFSKTWTVANLRGVPGIAESSPPGEDIRLASMPSPAKRGRREASVETDRESLEEPSPGLGGNAMGNGDAAAVVGGGGGGHRKAGVKPGMCWCLSVPSS